MKIEMWIKENTNNLCGKLVAITGASGDLGKEVCRYLAQLGANLLLLDRNVTKSNKFKEELCGKYQNISVENFIVDLEDFSSVKNLCNQLKDKEIDYLILNAGAYKISRKKTDLGYDNVFQINFISQYYLANEILKKMKERGWGKIIVVSSIANNYSKIDLSDIDFLNKKAASKVYGNSKRFLTYSMYEMFKDENTIKLSVTHPGISYTNITSHYPKFIFNIIKYPMKMIFPKPKKACLSIVKGMFEDCGYHEWIGPKLFNVWGMPKKKKIKGCSIKESRIIGDLASKIIKKINS